MRSLAYLMCHLPLLHPYTHTLPEHSGVSQASRFLTLPGSPSHLLPYKLLSPKDSALFLLRPPGPVAQHPAFLSHQIPLQSPNSLKAGPGSYPSLHPWYSY